MLRITRVDTLDDETLDIELSNGHLILFSMQDLLDGDPAYASLRGKLPFPCPVNEGGGLRWDDGPRLALSEILSMLARQGGETAK